MKRLQKKFDLSIQKITKKLVEEYRPDKIVLYGSLANGNPHENSDIDMLIIKDLKTKSYSERWIEVRSLTRELTEEISFEPMILTPKEVKESIEEGNFFIEDILEFGKTLYEKN